MIHPQKSEIKLIKDDLMLALATLRSDLTRGFTEPISVEAEKAFAHVQSFAAIALRVFAQTNSRKIRDAAMTEEIKARIDGRECL